MSELAEILTRRRRMSDASTNSSIAQAQLSKINKSKKVGEMNRKASFSKPGQQLQKKLEKRLAKESFADSVASFSDSSNLDVAADTGIDKTLKEKKKATTADHFDSPSKELDSKLHRRRQSMKGIKLTKNEDSPVSKKKYKSKTTPPPSSGTPSSPGNTHDSKAKVNNATATATAANTDPTSLSKESSALWQYILVFIMALLTASAWFLIAK
jgi:hypothetical protein